MARKKEKSGAYPLKVYRSHLKATGRRNAGRRFCALHQSGGSVKNTAIFRQELPQPFPCDHGSPFPCTGIDVELVGHPTHAGDSQSHAPAGGIAADQGALEVAYTGSLVLGGYRYAVVVTVGRFLDLDFAGPGMEQYISCQFRYDRGDEGRINLGRPVCITQLAATLACTDYVRCSPDGYDG